MLNRRKVFQLAIVGSLSPYFSETSLAASSPRQPTPLLVNPDSKSGRYFDHQLYNRSQSDIVDRVIISELKSIVRVLNINPGIKFIRDNNAFASKQTIVDGTSGTVVLGLALIETLLQEDDGAFSLAGICAHECAHIYQFFGARIEDAVKKSGIPWSDSNPTWGDINAELHADFISGYYLGRTRGRTRDYYPAGGQLEIFTRQLTKFGDASYTNPTIHGPLDLRGEAFQGGFRLGADNQTLETASDDGVRFALYAKR
ncbi:hypothetical protein [Bradyrhizobium guangdongense]|uniref:Metalloprotease n=1 Tax=Bradyrhizobium guangdongense TaxID=1325090 RepID=A0AA87WAR0_9BRAD|nr:hypothetical protein [Bradyrhizobium guangdongense]GGI32661.1 hypothetical protein GCM10010987_70540 [Bradyrhizobium guangdongense]